MFILWILLSFIAGILACIPLARVISPPPGSLIMALLTPWAVLFFSSEHPILNDIRHFYFSFVIGMCCYWIYVETIKKIKNS